MYELRAIHTSVGYVNKIYNQLGSCSFRLHTTYYAPATDTQPREASATNSHTIIYWTID